MSILAGKVAVVTGSGTGIGKAIAVDLARNGASVVTNNRMASPGAEDAQATAAEIIKNGGHAVPCFADVSDFEEARKLIQTAVSEFGKIDILVNNAAGLDKRSMPWEMPFEDWESTVRIHLTGAFNCIRHACGPMKEQRWGRIINTTSRAWIAVMNAQPHYAAAMAGVFGLTLDVAKNIGKYGVTCNAYSPFAKTRRTVAARFEKLFQAGELSKEEFEKFMNKPKPEENAPLVTYLASEHGANINGQVFGIQAGEICIFSHPVEHRVIRKQTGLWTQEDLVEMIPKTLLDGYVNPAPRQ